MKFALAGNQNCGKTTLFNQLTGANQHVGNFPGVTVDSKVGKIRGTSDEVVDLPGIYSLSPYTQEEIVTRDFLTKEHPDGIINIIDATNIERNFYLTLQLIQLDIPMVITLNMMDEVRANGGTIKVNALKEELGVPVVPISASKNEGVDELIDTAIKTAKAKRKPKRQDFCSGPVHRTLHAVAHLVEDHAENIGIPALFVASKLVVRDEPLLVSLNLSENEIDMIEHSVTEMEGEMDTDRKAAIADMRYTFIDKIVKDAVVKPKESLQHARSVKIDRILTNKYLAIPVYDLCSDIWHGRKLAVGSARRGDRCSQRVCGTGDGPYGGKSGRAFSSRERDHYWCGECAVVCASHCYPVFLFIDLGRQRLYGQGCVCDG